MHHFTLRSWRSCLPLASFTSCSAALTGTLMSAPAHDGQTSVENGASGLEEFFVQEPAPKRLHDISHAAQAFVGANTERRRPIALVTSGGTMIPLERNVVRFIDNFSTGMRGACIAERLLAEGYAVIYLHRKGCHKPYVQYAGTILANLIQQQLSECDGSSQFAHRTSMLTKEFCKHTKHGNYLEIPFETVQDYLFTLREVSCSLKPAKSSAILVLSAAVSDFYIPMSATSEHKIQSSAGANSLDLHLLPVPKALGALRESWCPEALAVSFKLETDPALLMPKATMALRKYDMHAVVANLLDKRYAEVFIVSQLGIPTSLSDVARPTKFELFRQAVAGPSPTHTPVHSAWSMQSNSYRDLSIATCALTVETEATTVSGRSLEAPAQLALEDALVLTMTNLHTAFQHRHTNDLK